MPNPILPRPMNPTGPSVLMSEPPWVIIDDHLQNRKLCKESMLSIAKVCYHTSPYPFRFRADDSESHPVPPPEYMNKVTITSFKV